MATRRLVVFGLLRALALTIGLVLLYFLLPLDSLAQNLPWGISFTIALVIFAAVTAQQVRAVLVSPNPAIRAIEGVAITVPLFILLFAATYFLISQSEPSSFSQGALTRTDALYFAVTVFSTVGFGDITATTQASRSVVTLQMVLDLIVLGFGVRAFVSAVRMGRERTEHEASGDAAQ